MLVTCKNLEDPFKNEGARVVTTFRRSRAANSVVGGGMWTKFKLIQAFMDVLLTSKNEDQIKNEGTRVVTTLLQLYVWDFFQMLNGS